MNKPQSITVNLTGEYPVFKRDGDKLVRLPARNASRRYGLTTNVQTGETYYIEYTDQEEAQADLQKAEWEAGAPKREIEAKRQADEARKFEDALQYQNRVVAFLDILGWGSAIRSGGNDAAKLLGMTLAQLQGVSSHFNSLRSLLPEGKKWPGNPVMTHFSDCLVISVDSDLHGRDALQNALYTLTSSLIKSGLLLRGGITRGHLFHDAGLVFGPALIDAYDLERKEASSPRVILSKELSLEWGSREITVSSPWIPSDDGYLFFNFLPPFMGCPFISDRKLWQNRLTPIRKLILSKAADSECPEDIYAKYEWLASYFDRVCNEHPEFNVERVTELATRIRATVRDSKA